MEKLRPKFPIRRFLIILALPILIAVMLTILALTKQTPQESDRFQLILYPIGIFWAVILAGDIGHSSKDVQRLNMGKRHSFNRWIVFGLFGWLVSLGFITLLISTPNVLESAFNVFVDLNFDCLWAAPATGLIFWITGSILSKQEYRVSRIWSVLGLLLNLILWFFVIWLIFLFLYIDAGF